MKKKMLCLGLCFCLGMAILTGCGKKETSAGNDNVNDVEISEKAGTEEAEEEKSDFEPVVLCDQDGMKVTVTKLEKNPIENWQLDLQIENSTDKNISVGITELKANDIVLDSCELEGALHPITGEPRIESMKEMGMTVIDVAAGDIVTEEDVTFWLSASNLEDKNIPELNKVTISLGIADADNSEAPLLILAEGVEIQVE